MFEMVQIFETVRRFLIVQIIHWNNMSLGNLFERDFSAKESMYVRWQCVLVACFALHVHDTLHAGGCDLAELCSLEAVNALFLSELRRVGQGQRLRPWEIPAAVLLEPEPFSLANWLLTASMKKSRPQLEKRYRTRLEELYANLSSVRGDRYGSA